MKEYKSLTHAIVDMFEASSSQKRMTMKTTPRPGDFKKRQDNENVARKLKYEPPDSDKSQLNKELEQQKVDEMRLPFTKKVEPDDNMVWGYKKGEKPDPKNIDKYWKAAALKRQERQKKIIDETNIAKAKKPEEAVKNPKKLEIQDVGTQPPTKVEINPETEKINIFNSTETKGKTLTETKFKPGDKVVYGTDPRKKGFPLHPHNIATVKKLVKNPHNKLTYVHTDKGEAHPESEYEKIDEDTLSENKIAIQYQINSGKWVTARTTQNRPNDILYAMQSVQKSYNKSRVRAVDPDGNLVDMWPHEPIPMQSEGRWLDPNDPYGTPPEQPSGFLRSPLAAMLGAWWLNRQANKRNKAIVDAINRRPENTQEKARYNDMMNNLRREETLLGELKRETLERFRQKAGKQPQKDAKEMVKVWKHRVWPAEDRLRGVMHTKQGDKPYKCEASEPSKEEKEAFEKFMKYPSDKENEKGMHKQLQTFRAFYYRRKAADKANEDTIVEETREKVQGALKNSGFQKEGDKWTFPGVMTQKHVDKLHDEMSKIRMERSPATYAHSWYNRRGKILVSLGGKTGESYHANIKTWNEETQLDEMDKKEITKFWDSLKKKKKKLEEGGATGTISLDKDWKYGRTTVPLAHNPVTGETKFSLQGQLDTIKNLPSAIGKGLESGVTMAHDVYTGDAPPAGSKAYTNRAMDMVATPGIAMDAPAAATLSGAAKGIAASATSPEDVARGMSGIRRATQGKPTSGDDIEQSSVMGGSQGPDKSKDTMSQSDYKAWKKGVLSHTEYSGTAINESAKKTIERGLMRVLEARHGGMETEDPKFNNSIQRVAAHTKWNAGAIHTYRHADGSKTRVNQELGEKIHDTINSTPSRHKADMIEKMHSSAEGLEHVLKHGWHGLQGKKR